MKSPDHEACTFWKDWSQASGIVCTTCAAKSGVVDVPGEDIGSTETETSLAADPETQRTAQIELGSIGLPVVVQLRAESFVASGAEPYVASDDGPPSGAGGSGNVAEVRPQPSRASADNPMRARLEEINPRMHLEMPTARQEVPGDPGAVDSGGFHLSDVRESAAEAPSVRILNRTSWFAGDESVVAFDVMLGAGELALLSGVAVLFLGIALPLWGLFRLGAMRALERRRQSATAPTLCLATLGAVLLLNLLFSDGIPLFTIYGVAVNTLWLWVVMSRGRRAAPKDES